MADQDGFGLDDLKAHYDVSRETSEKLLALIAALEDWRGRINLMGPKEYDSLWRRHILDSAQLIEHLPDKGAIADLGSGGGFPGLVLAIMRPAGSGPVHMIDSVGKKCAFLRQIVRDLGLHAQIHQARIEAVSLSQISCVTARALAPLDKLLTYAEPWTREGAGALFLKGQNWQEELTLAQKCWRFSSKVIPSLSHSGGVVLKLSEISRV